MGVTVGVGVCCRGVGAIFRQDLLFEEDGAGGLLRRDHECHSWGMAVIM